MLRRDLITFLKDVSLAEIRGRKWVEEALVEVAVVAVESVPLLQLFAQVVGFKPRFLLSQVLPSQFIVAIALKSLAVSRLLESTNFNRQLETVGDFFLVYSVGWNASDVFPKY